MLLTPLQFPLLELLLRFGVDIITVLLLVYGMYYWHLYSGSSAYPGIG